MKPLIIGQAPSRLSDPVEPLSGRSGRRLADLCGLSMEAFLDAFERRNLVNEWPGPADGDGDAFVTAGEARRLAQSFRPVVRGRRVVILGFSLAAGFGLTHPAMTFAPHWEGEFAFCPHPSGVSRWWNDRGNEDRARAFWASVAASAFELP